MKRTMLKLQVSFKISAEFAKYCFENGIPVLLSFTENKFFDGDVVTVYVAVDEDKQADFSTKWKPYVIG